jgi:hypothetical protein
MRALAVLPLALLTAIACTNDPDTPPTDADSIPAFALPWPAGETWFLVGGPHCDSAADACADDEPRYALDFAPVAPIYGNLCSPSMIEGHWVTAAAPGTVRVAGRSLVEIEHEGALRTGYYHLLTSSITVEEDQTVAAGDRLGQPSCEHLRGGAARGPHVHFYVCRPDGEVSDCLGDGESHFRAEDWELAGWRIMSFEANYEGALERDGDVRTAINERCDGSSNAPSACDGLRNDVTTP